MTVTLSLLFLAAAGVFILCRYAGLRVLHALVCVLAGFLLASTSLAPEISRAITSVIHSF